MKAGIQRIPRIQFAAREFSIFNFLLSTLHSPLSALTRYPPMKYSYLILFFALLFGIPARAATYYVETVARIKGQESTTISGWGLVSGLPGTGDNPRAYSPTAQAKLRELELAGLATPAGGDRWRSIASSRNSALVMVTVRIPATGAREGEMLDCTITSECDAESLAGGYLKTCFLKGPLPTPMELAEPLGMADGQLRIEDPETPTTAKIKGGCRLLTDFNNPYIEKGVMTLVIKPQFTRSPLMAQSLATSINSAMKANGKDEPAKAVGLHYVMVRVPEEEHANPIQYVDEVMEIPVTLTRDMIPCVVINEREGTLSIDESVEVRPSLVTMKNFVAEIRPPVPPGQQEINPNLFVDVDTEMKRRQMEGEQVVNTKLKALQSALDAVRATPEDMIAIIKNLDKQGAIIGDVIFVE